MLSLATLCQRRLACHSLIDTDVLSVTLYIPFIDYIVVKWTFTTNSIADTFWHSCSRLVKMHLNKGNGFNPFPHTTILQKTTLNIFCQKIENLYNWMDNLWLKMENIVSKGEIARFEQFLLLSLCFQKAICCRGVRKRLYEKKG